MIPIEPLSRNPLAGEEAEQTSSAPAPQHRAMAAFDICGFSSSADPHVMRLMRDSMYQVVKEASATAQMPWNNCEHEDRGDGLFLLAPPGCSAYSLVDPLVPLIRAGLAQVNRALPPSRQLRLRMAVHHGELVRDEHGVISPALNMLFRLLNAPILKARFEHGDLALIVSKDVYERVVTWGMGLIDQKDFQPFVVENKPLPVNSEEDSFFMAWAMLPPQPAPAPAPTFHSVDPEILSRLKRLADALDELLYVSNRHPGLTAQSTETED
ncbi:hypothetical protein D0T12_18325 [Actinomadura spongiicola]|uniref:Guanylate cyclase domain-containing protein n=1 Tax=Actinomadura spongiicola TaxID=2303421 RepID=A0A372GFE7_9ACTN|nr:hypothetical protein [Actinomadura spongiicola]RFS84116.1 hypothetical protein D0T12_18325 [Actinomadura spongiicola]